MPLTGAWKEASPLGLHEWTLSVLQPLVDEGRIRLIDATDALASSRQRQGCIDRYYFDFYPPERQAGRDRCMTDLLPQLKQALYGLPTGAQQ